jgi:hypothetical protein
MLIEWFAVDQISSNWLVEGCVPEALSVVGVRSRLYQFADRDLGYYEEGRRGFWYDGNNLCVHVVFKSEDNALHFESHLRNEQITINSPMNKLEITTRVSHSPSITLGRRIFFKDYVPTDSDSPQDTQSVVAPAQASVFEETSDEFKYQRIESINAFGSIGKAESCHLMSSAFCKSHVTYMKYDTDPNNRLAMSRDFHGWFDALNTQTPVFLLTVESVSDQPVVEGRYRVGLSLTALNLEYAAKILGRLIEGSSKTENPLVMRTYVHVTDPVVFKKCLEWKEKTIRKSWSEYLDMASAIP